MAPGSLERAIYHILLHHLAGTFAHQEDGEGCEVGRGQYTEEEDCVSTPELSNIVPPT